MQQGQASETAARRQVPAALRHVPRQIQVYLKGKQQTGEVLTRQSALRMPEGTATLSGRCKLGMSCRQREWLAGMTTWLRLLPTGTAIQVNACCLRAQIVQNNLLI